MVEENLFDNLQLYEDVFCGGHEKIPLTKHHLQEKCCEQPPDNDSPLLHVELDERDEDSDSMNRSHDGDLSHTTHYDNTPLLAKQLVSKVQLKALHVTMTNDVEKLREQCREQENEIFSLKQVQNALEGEVFELQQTLSNTQITHQEEIETITSTLKEKEWKTLSHFIVDKALTNARTISDPQLTREQPYIMTSEYFELERQLKENERELRTKFEAELQHVKVKLEENKATALDTLTKDFTLQIKQWENKVTELQQTMAALESTLVETHQKYQKEKDTLQANHNNELSMTQSKLDSVTEQLRQIQVNSEERHQQDTHTLELVHEQLSQVQQERDALHNALMLLQQSVANLLPLSSTIEAVLPKTDQHPKDLLDEEDSPSISPSNEPVTPPKTEWISLLQLQQDPTVQTTPTDPSHKLTQAINTGDSGLASQQTSAGRAQMEGALKQAPPPFYSHLSSEVYIGSVIRSLQPRDTTSCDEDTPKAPPSTTLAEEETPVITSGRLIPHDLTILSLNSTVTDDHTHLTPELSIVQLEPSHEITDNVNTIQKMISQLYQSVTRLLENFLTTSTQAIQYQQQLGDVQGDLVRSQTSLTSQLQHVERLQEEVLHLQHQISNHMTSNNELLRAQEKIASLITEVEILRQSKGEETTELINETEHLLQEHCHLEQSLTLLKTQLNDKQEEVNNKEQTCQQYQQQISTLEHEILTLHTKLSALQQLNKELQLKNENNEMQFRQQLESLNTSHNNLEAQLKIKDNRIHELEDLPAQLLIKEGKEEELLENINDLTSQLTTAQHKLACSATGLDNKIELLQQQLQQQKDNYSQLIKQHEDTVASLTTANEVILRSKTTECQLQEELTQCQSVLKEKETEVQEALAMKAQVEEDCVKLREQINTLTGQVETLHHDLQISSDQVSQLCQRLEEKESTTQDELSQLKMESTQHLQAFEKSTVRVQSLQDELSQVKTKLEERENELEAITISKAQLEDQLKSLQKEKMEKEEYYQLQVLSLHNNLKQVQSELSQKCSELEFVEDPKETREKEMKQLEEKLQDEYAGQLALLKLQIKELSLSRAPPTSDNLLLQQIAELTPVLERDAIEVQELCQGTGQQQQMEALKADNISLKKDIASAEQTMSELEQSMNLANTTLTQLQKELHNSTSRETQLLQQLEQQASDYQRKLSDIEQQYQDVLSTEREKQSKVLSDHKQTEKEKQDLSDKYDQLVKQYEEMSTRTSTTEAHLQDSLTRLQQELQQAHLEAKQSNDALKENVTRVTKLLAEIEDHDKVMVEEKTQFEQTLHKEKECVLTLKSALRNKETELTKVVDQYLQEKVTVAQLKGENSGLQARLTALQEEHMEDLQYQNALQTSETKCRHLALSLRQLEGQCKALVFQKRYLCSELDAFYHTQQATLMMIEDMGGKGIPRLLRRRSTRRFKIVSITILACIRWYNLYQRHEQRRKRNRPKHDHSFIRVGGSSIPVAQGIELFSNQTGVYLTERLQHKLHK